MINGRKAVWLTEAPEELKASGPFSQDDISKICHQMKFKTNLRKILVKRVLGSIKLEKKSKSNF